MDHYTAYFNLKENPFVLTPDPKYLYLGDKHREVLSHLLYGVNEEKGFMVVVGEVGTGKTTLCRAFINRLLKEDVEVGLIYNPAMTDLELLQTVNREFKISASAETKAKLIDTLNEFLLRVHGEGRKVVLIIDEAQNLELSVMEQLRLISNLETETGKLIQIILLGQPELERILAKKEMRQLDQRIVVRGLLGPLRPKETRDYIQHRVKIAMIPGAEDGVSFTDSACSAVFKRSRGIPRLINVLADRALLVAYAKGKKKIDRAVVKSAFKDLESSRYRAPLLVRWQTAVAFSVLVLAAAGWFYQDRSARLAGPRGQVSPARHRVQVTSPIPSPEPVPKKAREEKPEEDMGQILKPLDGLSRHQGWRIALESAFSLWNEARPVPPETPAGSLPGDTRLRLWETSGNVTRLSVLNYPAILELRRPGFDPLTYVLLRKLQGDRARILCGREVEVPLKLLNEVWYGHAFVLWKDFEGLPRVIAQGASSMSVTWLQHNLKYLGLYEGPVTGFYDEATKEAVTRLQKQRSIAVDGVVGPETLMVLYSLLDVYQKPSLRTEGEERNPGG